MRSLVILVAACLALAPLPSVSQQAAQPVTRATDASDCPIAPVDAPDDDPRPREPEWWSAQERYAWRRICAGQIADMRDAPEGDSSAGCDALDDRDWPEARVLTSRFLRQITSTAPWTEAPARNAVRIRCARVDEVLDLLDARLPQTLSLRNTRFGGPVWLNDARVDGGLSLSGSRVTDTVRINGLSLRDDLFLRNARFGDVNALGAQIGGQVAASGSTFTGPFDADRMSVGGSLFLRGGAAFDAVRLVGARIGGQVSAIGSTFTGTFNGDRLSVGGNLFMRDGAGFAEVDLTGAEIGGTAQFQGSDFAGALDLTGARIGDALMFSVRNTHARFGAGARLDLRNVHAGALQAAMPRPGLVAASDHPWRRVAEPGGHEPLPVDLSNFTYDRLGGFGEDAENDLSRVEAERLIAWVDASRIAFAGADGYAPQPFMQVANTLRDMGAEAAAEEVDFARLMHRMETRGTEGAGLWATALTAPYDDLGAVWVTFVDWIARWVVGFGIYPERALIWFAGLVGLGWAVSYASPSFARRGLATRFWYSLNNALPLVPLSQTFEEFNHGGRWVVANFYTFQKIAGFGLATVLVGALTLLGG